MANSLFFYWQLIGLTGIIEILFFSTLFYYFMIFLKRDRHSNLLFTFYAYCAIVFTTYAFNLSSVYYFLFITAPIAIMLFILVHQETLQRNFIVARVTQPITPAEHDWLSILMQSVLMVVNNNKRVICAIEKHDSLKSLLDASLSFNTPIQKDLMDILLSSTAYNNQKMIWINHKGELLSLNSGWKEDIDTIWVDEIIQEMEPYRQDALMLTNKTDALVFIIDPQTRLVDIVVSKKIIAKLSINEAVGLIKKYLFGKDQNIIPVEPLRGTYENINKKHSGKQLSS